MSWISASFAAENKKVKVIRDCFVILLITSESPGRIQVGGGGVTPSGGRSQDSGSRVSENGKRPLRVEMFTLKN